MTKIIRYSIYGFKPQIQTHHLKDIDYHLYHFNINGFPTHLQYYIQKRHDKLLPFYKEHYNDFKEGIWFFLDGYKNNQSLNHLKKKVPCWEAEIVDDVEVFDCNWEYITTLNDPIVEMFGCYLPKREMYKIDNIKRRINRK